VVDVGHRRELDLAVEVPASELGPVATNEMWDEVYDRLAELAREHRSTLVFVNTRRLVERVSHHLAERLGEEAVAAHHGSLSRKLRLAAEKKLKSGEARALVATASLELGIDIGAVAMCACEDWKEEDLFRLVRRAYPYRGLARADFDAVLEMLSEGIAARRGRYGAYLYRDRVNRRVRGRRGSRLAAITSGGAIPDN